MRKTRHSTRLIIILPILALIAGSLAYIARVDRQIAQRLPGVLSSAVSERMNGKLKLGKIEVYPLGIVLRDVSFVDNRPTQDKTIVRIPQVKIACRLSDIILGRSDPAKSIKQIELCQPTIHLARGADGKWNVMGLMKPSKPGKLVFNGKVFVRSAHVTFRDYRPDPTKAMLNTLSDVNAVIDFAQQPTVKYSVWGKGQPERISRINAAGTYDIGARSHKIVLDVTGGNAAYLSTYPWHVGVKVLSGAADGVVSLSKTPRDAHFGYSVTVAVHDAAVRFPQVKSPVNSVNGVAHIEPGKVELNLRGRLGSSPLTAIGGVTDFKHPQLAIVVSSDRTNFRELAGLAGYSAHLKQAVLPRTGQIRSLFSGMPKSLSISFNANAPSIGWRNLTGTDVSVTGVYTHGRIDLGRISLNAYGGHAEASGTVHIARSTTAEFGGRAFRVKLDAVPLLVKQKLAATSSGDFQLAMKPGGTDIRYQGTATDLAYHGFRFEQNKIDLSYSNGTTTINEMSARTMGGLIAVSGRIGLNGALSLSASGTDINLAKVRDMYWKPVTVGRAQFKGRVTGTLESPVFRGEIAAHKAMIAGVGMERIAGNITASRDRLTLDDLTAYHFPGTIEVSGGIEKPLSKSPALRLSLRADSFEVGGLTDSHSRFMPEGGRLSGEVIVSGMLQNPAAEADLQVEGGTLHGITVDTLRLRGRYFAHDLSIQELSATSGDSALVADGELTSEGKIALNFGSKHLQLALISDLFAPYARVTGDSTISGSVGGTLDSPTGEVSAACEDAVVNNQSLKHFGFKASLHDETLTLSDAVIQDGASGYTIPSASYDMNTDTIKLTARIEKGRIERILSLIQSSAAVKEPGESNLKNFIGRLPTPLSGTLNADVSGSVHLADGAAVPDIQASISLADMKFGENTFKSVALNGSFKDDVARIEKLEASDGDMKFSAQGSVGPSDALDLKMNGKGLDVATICGWLGLPHNFSGKADVTLLAGGTTRAPSSEMNLDITGPAFGGAKFDRLKGRLVLEETEAVPGAKQTESRINISDLTLGLGDRELRVSGYVPLDRRGFTILRDAPLLVQANLDSDSLALLSQFSGIKMETGTSGEFKGLVRLSGTVKSPALEGTLDWSEGRIQVPKLNSPFEGINARMSLVGDKITIDTLTGRSAEGGTFGITGDISLADMRPSLNLGIKTIGLKVSGRNFSNAYGEDVRARIEGDVKVTDYWKTPLLAGTVSIPDGSVAMPRKPIKNKAQATSTTMNPKFNLNVLVGQNVRFGAARLKTPLTGKLNVMGSLSGLIVDGAMDISGGTILFPVRRMKISPGSTMTLHMTPNQPPSVYVDMRAQTKATSLSSFGRPVRYTINMAAQGSLDHLNPEFTSSPPDLTDQTIVGMLAGQSELESIFGKSGGTNFGKDIGGLFSTALMPSVFEPISETFEKTLGLEDFSLEMGYQQPLMLTIGQHLVDGLYLDYSAVLGARPDYSDSAYQLKLSYRWKHGVELGVETDENRTVTFGVEGKLRF